MLQYLFWGIVFYLLFRFIFNFVIPVVRAGRQMKKQMREFQSRMNEQHREEFDNSNAGQFTTRKPADSKKPSGDYIDFEEIS